MVADASIAMAVCDLCCASMRRQANHAYSSIWVVIFSGQRACSTFCLLVLFAFWYFLPCFALPKALDAILMVHYMLLL